MAFRSDGHGIIIRHENHFYIYEIAGKEPCVEHATKKDIHDDWKPLTNTKYVELRNKLIEFISRAPKDLTTVSKHAERQLLTELLIEAKQRWDRVSTLTKRIEEVSLTDPCHIVLVRELLSEVRDYAEML